MDCKVRWHLALPISILLVAATALVAAYTIDAPGGAADAASTVAADASGDPVLVGAGDIANSGSGDEATARLLDVIPGTVATFGDNAYDAGTDAQFANYYDPTWGRHKARTKPSAGNHQYNTSGASGYFNYFGAAAGEPGKGYYSYDLRAL